MPGKPAGYHNEYMTSWSYHQKPLLWAVYEKLMHDMSIRLKQLKSNEMERDKLARYQIAIAFGCHLGPNAKELLHLKWYDVFNDTYTFRYEPHRMSHFIDQVVRVTALKNFHLLKYDTLSHFILPDAFSPVKPIVPKVFNKVLASILADFGIATPEPSYLTLRKTYARKIYEDLAQDMQALRLLSEELRLPLSVMKSFIKL